MLCDHWVNHDIYESNHLDMREIFMYEHVLNPIVQAEQAPRHIG